MAEYKSAYTGSQIDQGIAKANEAYVKPSGGIPKTDLASAVQTSLGKADSAIQDVSDKQDVLVSGTNIKTINNTSILGSGNIEIGEGGTSTDVKINGTSITSEGEADIKTQGTYNASSNKIATMSDLPDISTKQDTLVSGTNIKTINNQSILGSGNLAISGDSLLTEETITVGGDVPVTGLELDYTAISLEEDQEQRLACTVLPSNATDTRITWESSNTNIATVVDGLVTGISQGSATVTVTSVSNPSIKVNCAVTVTGDTPIEPTGIDVSPSTLSGIVGGSGNLTATLTPSGSTGTVVWTSSSTSIATVTNGIVSYVGVGTATITATVSGKTLSDTCEVTVTAPPSPTGIDVSPSTLSGEVGSTGSLTATITPSGATGTIVWSSGDTSVATVSNGTVTYVGAGNTTITATIDGTQLSDTCDVTVTAPTPETKVYLQDLTPVSTGKILNKNGNELAIASAAYWEVPYTEGMFASTLYNDGWIGNYPPIMIKNGTTLTGVTTTKIDYPTAGQSQYTATLTGYDANVSVIIQADYYSSASRREYLYYDTEGGE